MGIYYSSSDNAFYDERLHDKIPAGAVEITVTEWQALLQQQGEGLEIAALPDGRPWARVRTPTALDVTLRRNALLTETDGVIQRHHDELDLGAPTTLSADQFKAMLRWRQALRDVTKHKDFPNVTLPARPE